MRKDKKIKRILTVILAVLIVIATLLFIKEGFQEKAKKSSEENKDKNISEETISSEDENINEDIKVETKYCELYYPLKWEEAISVEKEEKDGVLVVEFIGKIKDRDEKHLFDIIFGGDEGVHIGTLNIDDEKIAIYVKSTELEFEDNWTEEEKNIIYSMQEDINYVIKALQNETHYTSD